MVAFENERLAEEAVKLWQEAFHDDEAYIRFFLNRHENTTVLTEAENGSLVSALYLLDGAVLIHNSPYKAYYLFAAATFERNRGYGYMTRLLQRAEAYCRENGGQYIALVPASPTLFDYYARFGYQTAFYARSVPADSDIAFDQAFDFFLWPNAHLRYMKDESKRFGYPLIEKSGMLFSVSDNKIKIPDREKKHPNGMLLPLTETARNKLPDNAYIGLTLE